MCSHGQFISVGYRYHKHSEDAAMNKKPGFPIINEPIKTTLTAVLLVIPRDELGDHADANAIQ